MITIVWTGMKADVINTPPNCFMFFIEALYHCGDLKPNHQLPAIRQHYEWGREFLTGAIVLLHFHYGPYDG